MKNIPIVTRNIFPIPDDHKKNVDINTIEGYYPFLPHCAFYASIWDNLNDDGTASSVEGFPPKCIAIDQYNKSAVLPDLSHHQDHTVYVNYPDVILDHQNKNRCLNDDDFKSHSQGVYFCIRSLPAQTDNDDTMNGFREIVYIGKTNNIRQRFAQHHKAEAFKLLNVDEILFVTYNPEYYTQSDILWAERQYIGMLKPILNDCHCSRLLDGNPEDTKYNAMQDISIVWDQAYNEGLKHGFASAKNKMMDFFDSTIAA